MGPLAGRARAGRSTFPDDLTAAARGRRPGRAGFEALGRSERYAVFLPLLEARTPEARARALRRALDSLALPATG